MLTVLLLTVSLARAAAPDAPERLELPGLPNLARVETGVYRGGRPDLSGGGLDSLRKLGVKTIVNLQGGDLTSRTISRLPGGAALLRAKEPGETPAMIAREKAAAEAAGMTELNVPLDSLDPVTPSEAAALDRAVALLAAATPENPVYVHCEHGKDRTGLVVGLYRMRVDGWTRERAEAEMAAMGHTGFLDRLFTGHMDLKRVLARFRGLAAAPAPKGATASSAKP